jgi:amidase
VPISSRSASDAGVLLGAIAGGDAWDPTAALDPVADYLAGVGKDVRGLQIGVDADWNGNDVDAKTRAVLSEAIETFRTLDAAIVEVQFHRRYPGCSRLDSQLRSGGCSRA